MCIRDRSDLRARFLAWRTQARFTARLIRTMIAIGIAIARAIRATPADTARSLPASSRASVIPGITDALDDAGKLLAVSAGVALIALAIAIPIAIMVLISLAVNRAWVRHARNRALKSDLSLIHISEPTRPY